MAAEGVVAPEEAGVQEVEDGLELREPVLDGRARERGPPRGPQAAHGARLGRGRVLDVLRLVEREVLPVHLGEQRAVAVRERVRRDEEVDARKEAPELLAARAAGAVVDGDPQRRREARGLRHPVLRDGGRADEERRADPLAGLLGAEKRREELDRLAEAHVVREARPEPARQEEAQPRDAAHLVRPENAREPARRGEGADLLARDVGVEKAREPALARDPVHGGARAVRVEASGEAQQLAERRAAAGAPVEDAAGLLEVLAVEEHPLAAHLDERHLPRREVLEFGRREERVADGDLPVEVDERVEAESRDAGVGRRASALLRDEAERDALERAAARQAHGDTGLAEERRLLRQELHVSSGESSTPVGWRSSRLRRTAEESDAAAPRRARSVSCRLEKSRPRRRTAVSGDSQISSAVSAISSFSVDSRAKARAKEPPTDSGGTTRMPRRSEPSGSGSRTGRLHSARRERTAASAAGAGVSARPATASASGPSPARRRSAGRTSRRTSRAAASTASSRNPCKDGRRGREAGLGRGRRALLRESARHGRQRGGEAPEALLLVGIRQDRPPARTAAVGGGRDAAAQEEVVRPARDLRPVLEIVAGRERQRPHAQDRRQCKQRLERLDGREDDALEQERLQDGRAGSGVVRGLAQGRDGRHGPPVHRGRHEGEGRDAGAGRREEAGEALVAQGRLHVLRRHGARVRVARVSGDVGTLGPEREAGGERGAVQDDQSRPLSGILRPR